MSDELAFLDATAQADLVQRRKVSPVELVDAAIARIERLDRELNAVIIPLFEKARAQAASPALPNGFFRGVPFLLKDIICHSAGDPYHAGMKLLRKLRWIEHEDTHLAAKFRAAGLVFLGRTNVPELGSQPTTEPEAYGPTRNPWDTGRSTGGSSGGSAAALLDAVAGPMPGDAYFAPPPARPFAAEVGLRPGRLRIGLMTRAPGDAFAVHEDCAAAARDAAHLLESLGHTVEEAHPAALDDPEVGQRFTLVVAAWIARDLDYWSETTGRPLGPDDVEPMNWAVAEQGRACSARQYIRAVEWLQSHSR